MSKIRCTSLALAAIALAGRSDQTLTESPKRPLGNLRVSDIRSTAMQPRMLEGVMNVSDTSIPDEACSEESVVPLLLPNRQPAGIVHCHVNTNMRKVSLVHSELSIPPRSKNAIHDLRYRHLFAD